MYNRHRTAITNDQELNCPHTHVRYGKSKWDYYFIIVFFFFAPDDSSASSDAMLCLDILIINNNNSNSINKIKQWNDGQKRAGNSHRLIDTCASDRHSSCNCFSRGRRSMRSSTTSAYKYMNYIRTHKT